MQIFQISKHHICQYHHQFHQKEFKYYEAQILSLAAQILLGPSSDRFTSIFFYKMPTKYSRQVTIVCY